VDTERVQFHQLTAVIFIQPALLFLLLTLLLRHRKRTTAAKSSSVRLPCGALHRHSLRRARVSAQKIIQIKQHCRTLCRRLHQVLEFPQRVRLNHVALVGRQIPFHFALRGVHVEVVEPEIVHHLLQLALAVNRARHFRHRQFFHNALRPFAVIRNRARHRVRIHAQSVSAGATRRRVSRFLLHRRRNIFHGLAVARGIGVLLRGFFRCHIGSPLLHLLLFELFLAQSLFFRRLLRLWILRQQLRGGHPE